ncbi:unnamed protein product, partial [Staurois parvus]
MGPCTASSCCCQARNLPWAPADSACPHAACQASQSLSWVPVRPPLLLSPYATLCHVPLSGLLTSAGGFHFFSLGCWQITGPHCCCQVPVICHGPPIYRLLMLLPSPESLMGPCTASHCCCLHRPHSAMCHFQVFLTLLVVPFCHRVLYGLPLLLPPPP